MKRYSLEKFADMHVHMSDGSCQASALSIPSFCLRPPRGCITTLRAGTATSAGKARHGPRRAWKQGPKDKDQKNKPKNCEKEKL